MNPEYLGEVIAVVVIAVVSSVVGYVRRRRRGHSAWESIRPWPLSLEQKLEARRPLPPWATPEAIEYLWNVAEGGDAENVPEGAEEAAAEISARRRTDWQLASQLLLDVEGPLAVMDRVHAARLARARERRSHF